MIRIRRWSSQSALFTTALGFGVVLTIGMLLISLGIASVDAFEPSPDVPPGQHWGLPQWLWSFLGTGSAVFAAGAVAYSVTKPRSRGKLRAILLLVTLFLGLAFLFTGVSFGILLEVELPSGSTLEFIETFMSGWWEAQRVFAAQYLLLISMWSTINILLPALPNRDGAFAHKLDQLSPPSRSADIFVGILLIAFGVCIAVGQLFPSFSDFSRLGLGGVVERTTLVDLDFLSMIALRAISFVVAGLLLVTPAVPLENRRDRL